MCVIFSIVTGDVNPLSRLLGKDISTPLNLFDPPPGEGPTFYVCYIRLHVIFFRTLLSLILCPRPFSLHPPILLHTYMNLF